MDLLLCTEGQDTLAGYSSVEDSASCQVGSLSGSLSVQIEQKLGHA